MPEETSNTTGSETTPDSVVAERPDPQPQPEVSAEPEPEIRFSLADATDQPGDGDEGDEGRVPSGRLREEADRRRTAEQQNALLQQQNLILNEQVRMSSQQAQAAAPSADPESELRSPFGPDEEGDKAFSAVKGVADHIAQQTAESMREEIRRDLQTEINQKFGSVTASMTIANQISGLQERGLIDESAGKEISKRMGDTIKANPQWGQAENQEHLLNKVWTDMMRSGEIKPRTVNPSQPGSNGYPMQPGSGAANGLNQRQVREQNDQQLLEIQRRNSRQLGGLSIEQLRELGGDAPQQGGVGDSRNPIQHSFVHRR
jgi:hypothetical protein